MKQQEFGLLGRNISYSLSPVMHNAAFKHFGSSSRYFLFDINEEDLAPFLEDKVKSGELKGLNVTVPYKIAMLEFLKKNKGRLDSLVEMAGAVNTVKIRKGSLSGYNTDMPGFYDSLLEDVDFDLSEASRFYVAGAGGAGRAIGLFLASLESAAKISVYDPDGDRLISLARDFKRFSFGPKFRAVSEDTMEQDIAGADLIVNATPLGTREGDKLPVPVDIISGEAVVYDLVYARETELVKNSREKGIRAVNGSGMLSNQAAMSFEIWTGRDLEEVKRVMKAALKEALEIR